MIKLMQCAMEKNKVQEFHSKNDEAQPVHCTNLRTKLGVFDDLSVNDLPPG